MGAKQITNVVTCTGNESSHTESLNIQQRSVRLLEALQSLGYMLVSFDSKGEIQYCSNELINKLGVLPPNRDIFIKELLTHGLEFNEIEHLLHSNDMQSQFADLNIFNGQYRVSTTFAQGDPPLTVLLFQSITDDKSNKAHLEHLERLATVGQVAAGAVHEFNNNLTSILGWAQIAEQNAEKDSPTATAVSIILENAKKAQRIFSKLLSMSRVKTDYYSNSRVSPVQIVEDALSSLSFEFHNRNIWVNRVLNEDGFCDIDEDRLSQVFINILKNAIEAIVENGELTVTSERKDDKIRISFCDTGLGMSEETIARVFESFFTTKKLDTSNPSGGTGLGLPVSLDILRDYDGDIEVTSELGKGSCFTVVLPALESQEESIRASFVARPTIPPGATVLVVDDEPDVGDMIRTALGLKGVSVVAVKNGEEALSHLNTMHFDAAFVDYSMPGISGHELARSILKEAPKLPIIFMSGFHIETDHIVTDFIKKPFDLDNIQEKLHAVLKRRKDSL